MNVYKTTLIIFASSSRTFSCDLDTFLLYHAKLLRRYPCVLSETSSKMTEIGKTALNSDLIDCAFSVSAVPVLSYFFSDRFTFDRTPFENGQQPANYCWYLMGLVFRRTIERAFVLKLGGFPDHNSPTKAHPYPM